MKARKRWRLYADNNIEKEIVDHLREEAFDVLAVAEDPQLRHRDDEFHYQRARQLDRYLLTHDEDFWDDRTYPLRQSPGVIILPKNEESKLDTNDLAVRKVFIIGYLQ